MNRSLLIDNTVIARGTEEGLVLRIDGRNAKAELVSSLRSFLLSRKRFLTGSRRVALEWLETAPEDDVAAVVVAELEAEFGLALKVLGVRRLSARDAEAGSGDEVEAAVVEVEDEHVQSDAGGSLSRQSIPDDETLSSGERLFQGIKNLREFGDSVVPDSNPERRNQSFSPETLEHHALVVYQTVRSGQRIEHTGTVIVFGDVNSGAEVLAGGDIVVLGILRGVAHAGAYHEEGYGRVIFALDLRPTQLRIGGIITRGGTPAEKPRGKPEVAKVDGDSIVVETYSARMIPALVGARAHYAVASF